uniref:Inosine/uridine-preferring nucleoside hydrolase domain-containing protein n=1 Tax=Arcella intermedia TaxID=1963864 RepID=A0A6B2LA08_9EUKA
MDCDPGHDDACAIMLAGHNPHLELLGISTVMGNQTLQKTTMNALKVLAISGLDDIKVVPGQAKPLIETLAVCPEIHGDSGLETAKESFPDVQIKEPVQQKAIIYMNQVFSKTEGKITIIATACLTNIALLLTVFPEVKEKIEEIVILGGAMGIGNMGPVMEWNIMVDPHAAKIVLESGLKIVLIPLEVTHTCLVTEAILDRIKAMQSPFSRLLVSLLTFFAETYQKTFNFSSPPLHDPLAVAYAIDPSLFETLFTRVDIEVESKLSKGQTVCDIYLMGKKELRNVHLATKVDVNKFWDLMFDAWNTTNNLSSLNKSKL